MSTLKFKEPSPYVLPLAEPPAEDYIYKIFEERVALKMKKTGTKTLNVAIFGMGRAGTFHLPTLSTNPLVNILYIVDNIESKWDAIRELYVLKDTIFLTSKDASIVYNDRKVNIVIVTSPTFTHENIILESLKGRKAIFCEKPLTSSYEASAVCYKAALAAGLPLFCAYNRRFDPSYAAAKERVERGEVGHVQIIKLVTKSSPLVSLDYIKTSGGIYHDVMSHVIDLMIWIVGEFPSKVSVQAHAHIPEIAALDDHDVLIATFSFPSGTLGMIEVARFCNYGADQRLEIAGSRGLINVASERPIHSVETQYGLNGPNRAPNYFNVASRYHEAYKTEMLHFFDVVSGTAKPIIHYKETLAVSKIATASEQSARTGKIVDITWTEEELPGRD